MSSVNYYHVSISSIGTIYKPVYNGQPRGITKVSFVDKWPLFGASETTYPIFMGQIKPGLCWQETTIRRCCYAHVWLLTLFGKFSINANTLIRQCLSIHVWLTILHNNGQVVTSLRAQNRSISQMTVASVLHMPFWDWTHVRRTVGIFTFVRWALYKINSRSFCMNRATFKWAESWWKHVLLRFVDLPF